MNLLKAIIKNFKLILILGRNDFKNKYLGSGLGSVWGFLNPAVQLVTYMFVYQVIFKSDSEIPCINCVDVLIGNNDFIIIINS